MQEVKKIDETIGDEYLEKFSFKPKFEALLEKEDYSHMPLVVTVNTAVFAAMCAILLANNEPNLTPTKIVVLISVLISLFIIPLNIWFIIRLQKRMSELKKGQQEVYDKVKKNINRTIDLFSTVIKKGVEAQKDALISLGGEKKELLENFERLTNKSDYNFLAEKGAFIFGAFNELSLYQTIDNVKKCMDSPLEESWSNTKLFIDRLSDKVKHLGLVINVLLLIIALLITTLT